MYVLVSGMAKKRDGFLSAIGESTGELPYWLDKRTGELPLWMRDRKLLPKAPTKRISEEGSDEASLGVPVEP